MTTAAFARGGLRVPSAGERRRAPDQDLRPLNGRAQTLTITVREGAPSPGRPRDRRRPRPDVARRRVADRDRARPLSITLDLGERIDQEALIDPYSPCDLRPALAWRRDAPRWSFCYRAGAWAVLGAPRLGRARAREPGRARPFHRRGRPAGDRRRGVVRSGPSCVDLRPDVAERMAGWRCIGKVATAHALTGSQPRRVRSRGGAPGALLLGWDDRPGGGRRPISAAERLELLYAEEYMGLLGPLIRGSCST